MKNFFIFFLQISSKSVIIYQILWQIWSNILTNLIKYFLNLPSKNHQNVTGSIKNRKSKYIQIYYEIWATQKYFVRIKISKILEYFIRFKYFAKFHEIFWQEYADCQILPNSQIMYQILLHNFIQKLFVQTRSSRNHWIFYQLKYFVKFHQISYQTR